MCHINSIKLFSFWLAYKILRDDKLTYFYLSLWSVLLEAKNIAGNSCFVGDDDCAMLCNTPITDIHDFCNNLSFALNSIDSVSLTSWYEEYYLLRFDIIDLADGTERARNLPTLDSFDEEIVQPIVVVPAEEIEIHQQSVEDQQAPDSPELSINDLYDQLDRYRPNFLYADKIALETYSPGDRAVVVMNVLSDVDYDLPEGWSYRPPTTISSLCVPLDAFNGLGVYEQIELVNEMMTLSCDYRPNTSENSTNTDVFDHSLNNACQTDHTGDHCINLDHVSTSIIDDYIDQQIKELTVEHVRWALYQQLQSPDLNFDSNFVMRERGLNHICPCLRCSVFMLDFINSHLETILLGGTLDNDFHCDNNCRSTCTCSYFNTETRSRRGNVDLDSPAVLSRSSPDILSTDSSSSSASSSSGGEQDAPQVKQPASQSQRKSPVVIINESGVPTNVDTAGHSNIPQDIVILDDTGTVPIVRLTGSPKILTTPIGTSETPAEQLGETFFTPPQQEQHFEHISFRQLNVPMERLHLDYLIDSTTWQDAHNVFEATRWGRDDTIPTEHVVAAALRILPIIASRASGGGITSGKRCRPY